MGTGAGGVVEGPIAGIAAVLVLTFAEAVFQLGPFDARAAWVFGGLVAALAPLGAPLASALAPAADAPCPRAAPARRLARARAGLVLAALGLPHLNRYPVADPMRSVAVRRRAEPER